jgi:hypothetical protein
VSGSDRSGKDGDGHCASDLADEHYAPAGQAVERCAGRQGEEQQRQQTDEAG